mgnify:CR=1 FL=1
MIGNSYQIKKHFVQNRTAAVWNFVANATRRRRRSREQKVLGMIGVAAHECGHAIQHARGYAPLSFRSALVPVANIGSQLSWLFIILGIFFGGSHTLIMIGILMFSAAVLFQLVTLPVEFNASGRALKLLSETGILQKDEVSDTRKVLSAAALTYVAAAATAVLQLLRLLRLFGGNDRD